MKKLALIVAMTNANVIGKDGDLPWPKIKEDMKHFRATTMGHAVIMGRTTWESIPEKFRPLPGRTNIVLTRGSIPKIAIPDTHFCSSLEDALALAYQKDECPFVIGGANVYKQVMDLVTDMHFTFVNQEFEGDTLFPDWSDDDVDWVMEDNRMVTDEKSGISLSIMHLRREEPWVNL